MGTMVADFKGKGMSPSFMDFLQIDARGGASAEAHLLRSMAGMPSGPAAAFSLNSRMASSRSSSAKQMLSSVDGELGTSGNRALGS